jgi:hypothetical protein
VSTNCVNDFSVKSSILVDFTLKAGKEQTPFMPQIQSQIIFAPKPPSSLLSTKRLRCSGNSATLLPDEYRDEIKFLS